MITTTTEEVNQWKYRAAHALEEARAATEQWTEGPSPEGAVTTFDALQKAVACAGPELRDDENERPAVAPLVHLQAELLRAMNPEGRAAARVRLCTYGMHLEDLYKADAERADAAWLAYLDEQYDDWEEEIQAAQKFALGLREEGDTFWPKYIWREKDTEARWRNFRDHANLAWTRQRAVLFLYLYPHLTPEEALRYAEQINHGVEGDILSTLALYKNDEQSWAELTRWRSRIFLMTYAQVQAYFSPVLFDGDPLLAPLVAHLTYRGLMKYERQDSGTFLAERYDQWKEWNARH